MNPQHRHARCVGPLLAAGCLLQAASASPVFAPWPADGPDDTTCVAAAAFAGWYATADSFEDSVEIRDIRGTLVRSISKAQITALLPWMNLGGGPDGPSALAWTPTGRCLYILVHDASLPGDGLGSDAVLRYDIPSDTLSVYFRLDAFDRDDQWPHLAMVHRAGRLFVGTVDNGLAVYLAPANAPTGTLASTFTLPSGSAVRGLTVDRDINYLFVASEDAVWRTNLTSFPALVFTQILAGSDIRALAWGDHFGSQSPSQRGLYVLSNPTGPGSARIDSLTFAQAYASTIQVPGSYTTSPAEWHDLTFTADGRLLVGADEDAVVIAETADPRLSFEAFLASEFQQQVVLARGLISPDGEPPGWVIDGDVVPGAPRFHPATPDAAAWAVLLLLMNDRLTGDPTSRASVRAVLTRYAGLAADGIHPVRSADGLYKHWIDPLTGTTESGWPDEFATLSTMKIVTAAARAMSFYPNDPEIVRAASRIIFRTRNWDSYLQPGTDALAFRGVPGGGPDATSFARPFHEGIIFVEQGGAFGGTFASTTAARWFNRSLWPTATYLTGRPITSTAQGLFEAAFISLYPALLSQPYRADTSANGWRTQIRNIRWSNAAWTDDHAPRYYTVFSAGTTPGGYNADSLGNHPADITTFTSLMALCAFGDTAEAVGAYAAYRKGARQTWKTGATLLYRRSDTDRNWLPDSAGLPDVALGGLGFAELLMPGSIEAVLARPYPSTEQCPVDLNGDGAVNIEELYLQLASPGDLNGDGSAGAADAACLRAWTRRNESADTRTR